MKKDHSALRTAMLTAQDAAKAANDALKQAQLALVEAVCRDEKITQSYIELMQQAVDDPIAIPFRYMRILDQACAKGLIKKFEGTGYMLAGKFPGSSSNTWYELGDEGMRIMQTLSPKDWSYQAPSKQFSKDQLISDGEQFILSSIEEDIPVGFELVESGTRAAHSGWGEVEIRHETMMGWHYCRMGHGGHGRDFQNIKPLNTPSPAPM